MQISNVELIEGRCDYITATCLLSKCFDNAEMKAAESLVSDLLTGEEKRGNDVRRFHLHSFEGLQCGQMSAAVSSAGYLIRLSGELAGERWNDVYDISTGVSRFDCAATFREHGAWRDLTRTGLEEARAHAKEFAPHRKVTRIDGGARGNTLNIGSRTSDSFGRLYDKYAESGEERYRDAWRYEVEFKRSQAVAVAASLRFALEQNLAFASVASQWFTRRGCRPQAEITVHALPRSCGESSDDGKRLRWFRRGVKGSLQKVIAGGLLLEALDALGLTSEVLYSAGYVARVRPSSDERGQL